MFLTINVNCSVRQILLSYLVFKLLRGASRVKFPAKQCIILLIGAFFGFAPFWAKHVQTVAGRGLFVTPDAMVLLGVTLLFSLLAYYLLPDFAFGRPASTYEVKFGGSKVKPRRLTWVKVLAVVFSLWAIVYGLYLVNQRILHSFLSSADEHSCYFLAECLRRGKLYVDIPPFADFFQVVHVGMKGGKWFSVYPPGWPLIWAIGLNLNIVDWLNPVMSALAIFFFYLSGKRLFGLWSTVVGLWLCVLSPFFMFTAASYFSHATCLLCISIFLYAFLRWREARERALCHPRNLLSGIQSLDSRFRGNDRPAQADTTMTKRGSSEKSEIFWASLCAFAVGYGLMTRYLTMAAVAGPFLLYHYLPLFFDWRGWGRGPWRLPVSFKVPRLRKSDWVMIGVIAVFMAVILWQNYLVTGKPFKAPNKYDKSWERLGFRSNYTPVDAFFYLVARVFYLMDWFAPAIVAAYLVLLTKIKSFILRAKPEESQNEILPSRLAVARQQRGQDDKIRSLFILTPVFIAVAYFFYYSWGGNQWGPR
jgi:hypothetical protein